MSLYSAKVQCFGCGKAVDKSATFTSLNAARDLRYQCPSCYVKNKDDILGTNKVPELVKREFFCGRCKYKFKAKASLCPYCSKQDQVVEQVHSVKDLL